jgi:hypothetical protein
VADVSGSLDVRDGAPQACHAEVLGSGWMQLEGRWYQVDACSLDSGELRFRGKLGDSASSYS